MERQRILFLHLSSGNDAQERLVNLIRGVDRTRFEPVLLSASGGNTKDAFEELGIETHVRPLCACFVNACREVEWTNFLMRPGVMLAVAGYCGYVRRFIREQRVAAVCADSLRSRVIGGIAARLAAVAMVGPDLRKKLASCP